MQHGRGQTAAGVFRNGCKAEMPGFGLYARQYAAKRTEKSESGRIGFQPLGKRREGTARRELPRRKLYPVPRREGVTIDEIDVRPPVVTARSGERGPQQYRLDALGGAELAHVDTPARRVNHGLLAAEFLVPNHQLAREIAKTALGYQIEALRKGRAA